MDKKFKKMDLSSSHPILSVCICVEISPLPTLDKPCNKFRDFETVEEKYRRMFSG